MNNTIWIMTKIVQNCRTPPDIIIPILCDINYGLELLTLLTTNVLITTVAFLISLQTKLCSTNRINFTAILRSVGGGDGCGCGDGGCGSGCSGGGAAVVVVVVGFVVVVAVVVVVFKENKKDDVKVMVEKYMPDILALSEPNLL